MSAPAEQWQTQIHPFTGQTRRRPRPQVLPWLLLVSAAFPMRFELGSRSASLFDVAVVLALVPFLVVVVARPARLPTPFLLLGVVSIGLALLSISWSENAGESVLYLVSSIEALIAFAMMIVFLQDAPPRQIAHMVSTWVLILLIPSVLLWMRVPGFLPPATLDPLSGDYVSYFARLSHPFIGRSNNIAALLAILIVPLAIWAFRTRHRFAGFAALVALGAVLLTLSRGTLLFLAAAIVVYLVVDWRHARLLLGRGTLPLLVAAGVSAYLLSRNDVASDFLSGRFSNANVDSRFELFGNAQQVIERNWFAGIGAGVGEDTHNTYIQQMVYFGLVGGIIVGLLIAAVALWWFSKRRQERWLAIAIGVGFLSQAASFFIESSYEGTLLRPLIWLGWGLLVAWWRAQVLAPSPPPHSRSVRAERWQRKPPPQILRIGAV